tara:strand:+ start:6400 stop:7272 length:873 start_codon:yes stop_codon:yes gene_type:complete
MRNSLIINLIHFFFKYFFYFIKNIKHKGSIKKIPQRNKDILLIVGAGETANLIKKTDWDFYEKNSDIAALSYGVFIPPYVNFFFFEPPNLNGFSDTYIDNYYKNVIPKIILKLKAQKIKYLFIKNAYWLKENLLEYDNTHSFFNWSVRSDNTMVFLKIIRFFHYFKITEKALIQKNASITSIIFWAAARGYKKVILSGIDLNNNKCFFETNPNFSNFGFLSPELHINNDFSNKFRKKDIDVTKDHVSNQLDYSTEDVIHDINSLNLCEMYVTSNQSRLAKFLNIFEPNNN